MRIKQKLSVPRSMPSLFRLGVLKLFKCVFEYLMTISRQPPHTALYCFHSAAGQRSRLWGKHGDRFLITVPVDPKIKIPAWHCLEGEAVVLFDSYFTFESKLGWHRLFLTVESTRGIRTLVVVFELLEEMVAWGWRNGKFNKQFQILSLELKVKFIWIAFVYISDGFRSTWLIYISYATCWQVPQYGAQTWRLPKIR